MTQEIRLRTPAKINLSLDIVGKRPDGYHMLRSVFQAIGIYDTLTITRTDPQLPMTMECSDPEIPCDAHNLVWKAAEKLLGCEPKGLHIRLEKQIPSQAGMGGGSSDCAAALIGIRRLFDLPVSDAELHAMAASLGADVAFFLHGSTMLAEGIGEQLTKVDSLPEHHLVIAKGNEGISTPGAYRMLDGLKQKPKCNTEDVLKHLQSDAKTLFSVCGNHFDAVTDLPEVCHIREIMKQHAIIPILSGSGAAVFGGCADEAQAKQCADSLRKAGIPFVETVTTVDEGVTEIG
ncbi:MAG: 4-(cytidine 5'-diphospho)-2-C-methyl-D-erythritol kinase [Oscillospiraceae bacterium]|nr:4-(cytidine 5'-diphospho)-2-C-methyl-D-erythritol kinase [Oscillospiraceae bacterium]